MERYRFRQHGQRPWETTRVYIVASHELLATCNFRALTNEFIQYQLIEKASIPRVCERLVMEPDTLTLERACPIATQIEQAINECKSITDTWKHSCSGKSTVCCSKCPDGLISRTVWMFLGGDLNHTNKFRPTPIIQFVGTVDLPHTQHGV